MFGLNIGSWLSDLMSFVEGCITFGDEAAKVGVWQACLNVKDRTVEKCKSWFKKEVSDKVTDVASKAQHLTDTASQIMKNNGKAAPATTPPANTPPLAASNPTDASPADDPDHGGVPNTRTGTTPAVSTP